ncbi:YoaK family protein [Flavobacterium sedimenticola]|uniref:YoaK family protein n=1 Tax=Flavobacterium sedimenticola TaxID=3043286 RepID=A0ABT6XTB6_9FLAO|nr:YoaK family protein [Flavobacterium sedimenticola]MDI9258342.1 YoaK family protein [Flavobacterium sedimenticola]
MFRHQGKARTFLHNLRLAALLSLVAGIVNVTGVLALQTLTTNVTGHFAYFAEEITKHNYGIAVTFLFFTFCFLLGSFTASTLVEMVLKRKPRLAYVVPITLEISILTAVALFLAPASIAFWQGKAAAFLLLFAMGVQNSLVTKVSQSTVRTTHLTGLFTDLGIELSQLFFYKKEEQQRKLKNNIYLRFSIIAFFFIGCVLGGFVYGSAGIRTLFLASAILVIALYYDYIRLKIYSITRVH